MLWCFSLDTNLCRQLFWDCIVLKLSNKSISLNFCFLCYLNAKQKNCLLPWNNFSTHFVSFCRERLRLLQNLFQVILHVETCLFFFFLLEFIHSLDKSYFYLLVRQVRQNIFRSFKIFRHFEKKKNFFPSADDVNLASVL